MNFNQPINQNSSHFLVDVRLIVHETWSNLVLLLFSSHVGMNLSSILSAEQWVLQILKVHLFKLWKLIGNKGLKFSKFGHWREIDWRFWVHIHVIWWGLLLNRLIHWMFHERSISLRLFEGKIDCHFIFISTIFWTRSYNTEWFVEHWYSSGCSIHLLLLCAVWLRVCRCETGSSRSLLRNSLTFKISPLRIAWTRLFEFWSLEIHVLLPANSAWLC